MRRRHQFPVKLVLAFIGVMLLVSCFLLVIKPFPSQQAERVVEEFYQLEQEGDFTRSWELLHSTVQARFPKGTYVTDRSHVFIGHFGADTFTYTIAGPDVKRNWKPQKQAEAVKKVYFFEVTQTYHGKYGQFNFVQYVYAAKEKGKWRIIWNYNGTT